MNNQGLSELDAAFDTATYVNPNSTVLDITVVRGNYNKSEFTPNMTQQLDQYAEMLVNYYRNVVS
jgi:protein associated with RNAse G/E